MAQRSNHLRQRRRSLVTMATRKVYGRDFLEQLDLKPYLKRVGERPSVKKTSDDRKAAQEAAAKK